MDQNFVFLDAKLVKVRGYDVVQGVTVENPKGRVLAQRGHGLLVVDVLESHGEEDAVGDVGFAVLDYLVQGLSSQHLHHTEGARLHVRHTLASLEQRYLSENSRRILNECLHLRSRIHVDLDKSGVQNKHFVSKITFGYDVIIMKILLPF